jgi:hypothetical protein
MKAAAKYQKWICCFLSIVLYRSLHVAQAVQQGTPATFVEALHLRTGAARGPGSAHIPEYRPYSG